MIIQDKKTDVAVSGAQSLNSFTIKASSKAFEILSSNLYSNKLGAVIRELSTNALDAHIENGNPDTPFHITVPTTLDPTLTFRDFGTGLSEDQIHQIYTVLFESTKTNSNDVIGCLGLGSKSPFGITDSFIINSYFNGTKSTYSAFLDESRIPCCAKFIETPTDEPNGIELQIPVPKDLISRVVSEIKDQLKFFPVKPIVFGADINWLNLSDDAAQYAYDDWKLYKKSVLSSYTLAVQGYIGYKLDTRQILDTINGDEHTTRNKVYNVINNSSIVMHFPIGALNIAPSREALSYDAATCKNIIDKAVQIYDTLAQDMMDKLQKSAHCEWQFKLAYYNMNNDYSTAYILRSVFDTFEPAKKIIDAFKCKSMQRFAIPANDIEMHCYATYSYNRTRTKWEPLYLRTANDGYRYDDNDPKFYHIDIADKDKFIFIVDDNTSQPKNKIKSLKEFANNNDSKKLYKITGALSKDQFAALLPDGFEIIHISEIPSVSVKRSKPADTNDSAVQVKSYRFKYYDASGPKAWNVTQFSKSELKNLNEFYVDLDRYDPIWNGNKMDVGHIAVAASALGIIPVDAKIYAFPKNVKIEHNCNNLFQYIADNGKKIINGKLTFNVTGPSLNNIKYINGEHIKSIIKHI